jgi:hypothetical protein
MMADRDFRRTRQHEIDSLRDSMLASSDFPIFAIRGTLAWSHLQASRIHPRWDVLTLYGE